MRPVNFKKPVVVLVAVLFPCSVLASQSFKTSFDCAKAASKIEKTICEVEELADADRQLGSLYKSLISTLPEPGRKQVKSEQIHWLNARDTACGFSDYIEDSIIIECLRDSYRRRIEALKVWQQTIERPFLKKNAVLTDRITIPLIYAEGMAEDGDQHFLISKNSEKPFPVFGVPSHFYPYEGTPIRIESLSGPLYLSYIGMRINNRQLIRELNIQFEKYVKSDREEIDREDTSFWDFITDSVFPDAHACGPYFGYEPAGSSRLQFVEEKNGVAWFKMVKPIDMRQKPTMMQLFYLPSRAKGKLTIELISMVFSDGKGGYYKPTFTDERDVAPEEINYGDLATGRRNYEAYLGSDEKGLIALQQDALTRKIQVTFKNNGVDPIIIDNHSLFEIEARLTGISSDEMVWRVKSISLNDMEGKVVSSLSFDEIRRALLGQRIDQGSTSDILFQYNDLPKEKLYHVLVNAQKIKSESKRSITDRDKVIYWQLGKSPYEYYSKDKEASPIYWVYVNNDGSADIEEIRKDSSSYISSGTLNSFIYKETGLKEALQWNRDQHVSALLDKPKEFSWAVVVPKAEVKSYVERTDSLVGNMKGYSNNLITIYRRGKYQSYISTGVIDGREVGIIYEIPVKWLSKPKISQCLTWMIKANTL